MTRPATAAPVEEAEDFLARHPDIVAFDLVLVDLHGIGRGKIIRRHELLSLYRIGRHLPGSILGLDATGEDVEATGLVWAEGDADRRAWPIPGSLVPMPWTEPPRGQVQVMLYELDGAPMPVDPRHALARQDALFRAEGRVPTAAFELEFYLLDRAAWAEGHLAPARGMDAIQVYALEELHGLEPLAAAIYEAGAAQGLVLEAMISEYAAGQFELTLRHRADILRAADEIVMLKRLVRAIAARHGLVACFMAKPFAAAAGSGMHCHVSLGDAAGRNLFADTGDSLAPLLTQSIAGLLGTMADSMLVFAPHLNSWRRFAAGLYAPVAPTWGVNNRSVAVRVPAGAPEGRHLEHRPAGVDANPYLVAATVLAGMRRGIAMQADPGPAVTGNGYAAADPDALAPDWRSAILAAERSAFLREALGDRLVEVFLALKRADHARFARDVTPLELKTGLEWI